MLVVCGSDTDERCEEQEEEEDGREVGESEAAERLFWRGRVILSYTGATARLLSLTCRYVLTCEKNRKRSNTQR